MKTEDILFDAVDRLGWNESSQRSVLEEYVGNQGDPAALHDFMTERALNEGAEADEVATMDYETLVNSHMGWNDASVVDALVQYIDRQDSNDAFRDFMDEKISFEESASLSI